MKSGAVISLCTLILILSFGSSVILDKNFISFYPSGENDMPEASTKFLNISNVVIKTDWVFFLNN